VISNMVMELGVAGSSLSVLPVYQIIIMGFSFLANFNLFLMFTKLGRQIELTDSLSALF